MDLLKVKNENDCEKLATVDAHDDGEVAGGWMICLEEVFGDIKSVKILDKEVTLTGFDIECENSVVAVSKTGKKTARVSLSSIEWPKLTRPQQLWLKAWNKHAGI